VYLAFACFAVTRNKVRAARDVIHNAEPTSAAAGSNRRRSNFRSHSGILFRGACPDSVQIDCGAPALGSHHCCDRRGGVPPARSSLPSKTTNALPARPARSARASWLSFAPLLCSALIRRARSAWSAVNSLRAPASGSAYPLGVKQAVVDPVLEFTLGESRGSAEFGSGHVIGILTSSRCAE
jgi:hypothetical protein